MRIIAATILAATVLLPLYAAEDITLATPQDLAPGTRFVSPLSTTFGYWQLASTGQFKITPKFSLELDYLHYQTYKAEPEAPEPDIINLRGAYNFTHQWQGFVQVAGGTYLMRNPYTALALTSTKTETRTFGGGIRYNFGGGLYLEGIVQVVDPKTNSEPMEMSPLMSLGYRF